MPTKPGLILPLATIASSILHRKFRQVPLLVSTEGEARHETLNLVLDTRSIISVISPD